MMMMMMMMMMMNLTITSNCFNATRIKGDPMIETVDEKGIMEIVHQGPLTAVYVPALKEKLAGKFMKNTGVRLNFCDTSECDTLGIQLLCVFSRTATAQKKSFILKGDLDCVLDTAVRVGLTPEEYFLLDTKEN